MVKIEPLSSRTIEQTKTLLHTIFPVLSEDENPDIALPASLDTVAYSQSLAGWDIPELRYWVALDDTEKVVGTVVLYRYGQDMGAVWLGWYGVSPETRGKGVGRELLTFALQTAKATGEPYLRLYTSTDPNEAVAVSIYERMGFKKMREEPIEGTPFKTLFYQLDLNSI